MTVSRLFPYLKVDPPREGHAVQIYIYIERRSSPTTGQLRTCQVGVNTCMAIQGHAATAGASNKPGRARASSPRKTVLWRTGARSPTTGRGRQPGAIHTCQKGIIWPRRCNHAFRPKRVTRVSRVSRGDARTLTIGDDRGAACSRYLYMYNYIYIYI